MDLETRTHVKPNARELTQCLVTLLRKRVRSIFGNLVGNTQASTGETISPTHEYSESSSVSHRQILLGKLLWSIIFGLFFFFFFFFLHLGLMRIFLLFSANNNCPAGYYGFECDLPCNCVDDDPCLSSGFCIRGCQPGYIGNNCDQGNCMIIQLYLHVL